MYARVIGISRKIRDVLAAAGVPEGKLWCVRSAVDTRPWLAPVERGAFLAEFGLPEDALTLGMAAQLIPRKGHRHLFAALPRLCEAHPALRVVLFGRGRLEAELRAEAAAAGLGDRVVFAGFREDLPRWLGGLDVFVHPAEMEGLGIAVLQASAAACRRLAGGGGRWRDRSARSAG
jgi:glycosyltransferase involved in cell wall biosynthesis